MIKPYNRALLEVINPIHREAVPLPRLGRRVLAAAPPLPPSSVLIESKKFLYNSKYFITEVYLK